MYKYIIITGAMSGFGLAATKLFSENGWRVVLTERREKD